MNSHLFTRRDFIRTGVLGGALTWSMPGFLLQTAQSLHAAADGSLTQVATGKDSPILVVLQLAGGNDGLNTLIPFASDDYYRARPKLGIPAANVIKLNDSVGLHPSLTDLKALYDEGLLSMIQAVGYPNPNRSHFRSMEIWQTASDSERVLNSGWIGRYFDNACQGCDPTVGVALGRQAPQAFASPRPTGITFDNPNNYRLPKDVESTMSAHGDTDSDSHSSAGASIEALGGATPVMANGSTSSLDFLERVELDAHLSSNKIREINTSSKNQTIYPRGRLAQDLSLIARLIGGHLPTRIYYVSMGGFDTHANQFGTHDRLMKDFSSALRAFMDDLKKQGNLDRTTVLVFSEFGRRVQENASGGTDHGSGAPVFVCGGGIKGGIVGSTPSLAPQDLSNGDVKFQTDFRSVYATLLEHRLSVDSKAILAGSFPLLGFA